MGKKPALFGLLLWGGPGKLPAMGAAQKAAAENVRRDEKPAHVYGKRLPAFIAYIFNTIRPGTHEHDYGCYGQNNDQGNSLLFHKV